MEIGRQFSSRESAFHAVEQSRRQAVAQRAVHVAIDQLLTGSDFTSLIRVRIFFDSSKPITAIASGLDCRTSSISVL
jgi:hypothetical protein